MSSDPFDEGLEARLSGVTEDRNPYDPDTDPDACAAWFAGWESPDNEEN